MKILTIGDLHLKDNLGYSDFIEDRREGERKEILDFIVSSASDCDVVVFMGDQLNARINSAKTLNMFINLIESFGDKKVYMISGNHERFGDGRTAIDFLKEIKGKNWEIITNDTASFKEGDTTLSFAPFFTQAELNTKDKEEACKLVKSKLKDGDILFTHHAISKTLLSHSGMTTDIFPELVLPRGELENKYKLVVGGHIHSPSKMKNTIITGSVFCNEVSETEKFLWKINTEDMSTEKIKIPGRGIYKLVDPGESDIKEIDKNNIVKVIITKKKKVEELEEMKKQLKKFDAFVFVESVSQKRNKKIKLKEGQSLLDFSITELLELYAKEKGINCGKLISGFDLIKE